MGSYFERIAAAYLEKDPIQAKLYEDVVPFANWAEDRGLDKRDIGINLVAKLADADGYAAIQWKFYGASGSIAKKDIDSFISASGREPFRRSVIRPPPSSISGWTTERRGVHSRYG